MALTYHRDWSHTEKIYQVRRPGKTRVSRSEARPAVLYHQHTIAWGDHRLRDNRQHYIDVRNKPKRTTALAIEAISLIENSLCPTPVKPLYCQAATWFHRHDTTGVFIGMANKYTAN